MAQGKSAALSFFECYKLGGLVTHRAGKGESVLFDTGRAGQVTMLGGLQLMNFAYAGS